MASTSEKQGLFATYNAPGLRPDYYREVPEHRTGIILEVERGKTTINNMDLLDLWKCHICAEAHHLFLLVPQVLRQNEHDPRVTKPYDWRTQATAVLLPIRQLHQRPHLLALRVLNTSPWSL